MIALPSPTVCKLEPVGHVIAVYLPYYVHCIKYRPWKGGGDKMRSGYMPYIQGIQSTYLHVTCAGMVYI